MTNMTKPQLISISRLHFPTLVLSSSGYKG